VRGGGSASAAVPGRTCENTAGRGLRWAQVPRPYLDPHTARSEKCVSGKRRSRRWESWVGILFFRMVIACGRLRSSSCEHVGHWTSVHCRTFCVELHVLNEWSIVAVETIRGESLPPPHFDCRDSGFRLRPSDEAVSRLGFFRGCGRTSASRGVPRDV
jgi:hypothetical protein